MSSELKSADALLVALELSSSANQIERYSYRRLKRRYLLSHSLSEIKQMGF
jgi:hypothetical protein